MPRTRVTYMVSFSLVLASNLYLAPRGLAESWIYK